MKALPRTILVSAALAAVFASSSCDQSNNAAEKVALEKKVAELERQNAERQRQAAEEELARVKEELAAERAGGAKDRETIEAERSEIARERAAMQTALETSAPKAVIVEEEPEAAKLAIEVQDVPVEQVQRNSHDQLMKIAGKIAIEIADKMARDKNKQTTVMREPLRALPTEVDEDYGVFYANLQHFGTWFQTTDYGYVWQPAVVHTDPQWRPYTRGHWVYSDQGWMWASDEPFGWATYHYGRWAMLDRVGWVWIPGEQWAPAWVSWRRNNEYIGWAPLPPETLYDRECAYDTRVDQHYGMSLAWYSFVPARSFGDPVRPVCLSPRDGLRIARTTTNSTKIFMLNNRVHVSGIDYKWVNARRGSVAPTCKLARIDHRTRGNRPLGNHLRGERMEVCSPEVNAPWNAAVRPGSVSRNLGRVMVARNDGVIERSAVERYYKEALQRQQLARHLAASDQGRQALMRRQIAMTRVQDQTRLAGQRYHEQCEHDARQQAGHAGHRLDQARQEAEAARRMEEQRIREIEAQRARDDAARMLHERRQQAEIDRTRQAEIARRQAEEGERLAKLKAMEEEAKRPRAQRPGQVEQARRAEMERRKAAEAKQLAELKAQQDRIRRAEVERQQLEAERREAALNAQRAAEERMRRKNKSENARQAEITRQQAEEAQRLAKRKAMEEEARRQANIKAKQEATERAKREAALQEQTRRAEMDRRKAEEAKKQAMEREAREVAEARRLADMKAKQAEAGRRRKAVEQPARKQPARNVPSRNRDAEIKTKQAEVARLKQRAQRPDQVEMAKRAEAELQKLIEAKRQADLKAKSPPKTPPTKRQPPTRTKPAR